MACPQCGCEVTYYCGPDDMEDSYDIERCAACGAVFGTLDAADDNDFDPFWETP